jgi:hypothetical protein
MSIRTNLYENEIDYCWYDSSNLLYSECVDNKNDFKTLYIVFKNGVKYVYKDVNVNDYLMFRTDLSQGIALNKYLKKYKYEKLEMVNITELKEREEIIKLKQLNETKIAQEK